jgi:predicted phage terminase large subunit-like protein
VPDRGNMIQGTWLRYCDRAPDRSNGRIVLSLDTASKTNPENDFSACTVWLWTAGQHYLLDVWRDKVDFPGLRQALVALYHHHNADTVLVEDQGVGSALIQELGPLGIPAIACKSRDSKAVRLSGVSAFIEAGQVVLPRDASFLATFVSEVLAFPAGRHDDQVDSMSQYLAWSRERGPAVFDFDFGFGETPDLEFIGERLLHMKRR